MKLRTFTTSSHYFGQCELMVPLLVTLLFNNGARRRVYFFISSLSLLSLFGYPTIAVMIGI